MKNNRKLTIVLASAVAVGASSLAALAQQSESSNWIEQRVAKHVIARIEGRLNLTSDQRAEIKSIMRSEQPVILQLADRGRQEHEELMLIPAFDEAKVRDVVQRYSATNADILIERAKVRMELRAVLNDAQRQQLDRLRARLSSDAGERFDRFIELL